MTVDRVQRHLRTNLHPMSPEMNELSHETNEFFLSWRATARNSKRRASTVCACTWLIGSSFEAVADAKPDQRLGLVRQASLQLLFITLSTRMDALSASACAVSTISHNLDPPFTVDGSFDSLTSLDSALPTQLNLSKTLSSAINHIFSNRGLLPEQDSPRQRPTHS